MSVLVSRLSAFLAHAATACFAPIFLGLLPHRPRSGRKPSSPWPLPPPHQPSCADVDLYLPYREESRRLASTKTVCTRRLPSTITLQLSTVLQAKTRRRGKKLTFLLQVISGHLPETYLDVAISHAHLGAAVNTRHRLVRKRPAQQSRQDRRKKHGSHHRII